MADMKISFNQLLGFSKRATYSEAINNRTWNASNTPYADTTGFHLYSDLDMQLGLIAGGEAAAARTLQILQCYAWAAEAVCEADWLRVLEVQGQRLHLFAETSDTSPENVQRLIRSCRVFHGLASREINQIVQDEPFNIRMAADYGRAILLRSTGDDISESVVSLGNVANRPAKHLTRSVGSNGVPAGHIALNSAAITNPDGDAKWELINLVSERIEKTASLSEQLVETANSRFDEMVALAAKDFETNPKNPVHIPIRRKGYMLRADLDGFSNRVKEALAKGEKAIVALVHTFEQIMKYPVSFKDELPDGVSVVCFPWAGDCANLFLQCEDYDIERTHLPSTAALKWHKPKSNGTNWRALLEKAEWLVAIAGGDEAAQHGNILTGNVIADGRTFHVGAGWSWRRSLDAEQSKGTRATETVIQNEDYSALDKELKNAYREHPENPSLFKVASLSELTRTEQKEAVSATISAPAIHPVFGIRVAPPKPYVAF